MASVKIPSIQSSRIDLIEEDSGIFNYNADSLKRSDLFLNVPASTEAITVRYPPRAERGWIVARNAFEKCWEAVDVVAIFYPTYESTPSYVSVDTPLFSDAHYDKLALGVDTRMKLEDVNGATIIKKNKSGTKWIFQHAEVEEHHDRMLLAETAMATLFDELTYSRLSRVLTVIIQGKPKNQQLGEAAVMEHINNFKHDCMRMARWHEGELDIGVHVKDPEEHYIYNMLQKAFATAEKKWQTEKSAELNQISDHIAPIKKRLASRHSFKFRWERPTVFPDAPRTPQSTPRTRQSESESRTPQSESE